MAYRTPSSVRTHVSVPTSDDLRVKDVRELRVDAQRLLDSREREEPEGLASPSRGDEEARSPVEAFWFLALARVEEPLRINPKLPYVLDAQVLARRDGDVGPHA